MSFEFSRVKKKQISNSSTLIWYELTKWLPPLFVSNIKKGQLFIDFTNRVGHYYIVVALYTATHPTKLEVILVSFILLYRQKEKDKNRVA